MSKAATSGVKNRLFPSLPLKTVYLPLEGAIFMRNKQTIYQIVSAQGGTPQIFQFVLSAHSALAWENQLVSRCL